MFSDEEQFLKRMLQMIINNIAPFIIGREQEKQLTKILKAMKIIDRRYFVEKEEEAYFDSAMPIGQGQTISQPSTVARMLLLAELKKGQNVLEIGSGSGWDASLIAYLVWPGHVLSTEIIPELTEKARKNFQNLEKNITPENKERIRNVEFKTYNILKERTQKKIDRVIITAGITEAQEAFMKDFAEKTLNKNGILLCPYTSGPIIILKKEDGKIIKSYTTEYYAFVPLIFDDLKR